MKKTSLSNPEILVKDERIIELDQIVSEVKESEEWEAVEMNILEVGIEAGRKEGIKVLIETLQEFGKSKSETVCSVAQKFGIKETAAEEYVEEYWK